VLRRGFGVVRRFLLDSTQRIRAGAPTASEWERIEAARADLQTLSTESLQTFHVLLSSISAESR